MTPAPVDLAELDAILDDAQPSASPLNIADMTAGLGPEELADIATECHCGPRATIEALAEGVLLRHSNCAATVAALTALVGYHLPRLLELHGTPPYAH